MLFYIFCIFYAAHRSDRLPILLLTLAITFLALKCISLVPYDGLSVRCCSFPRSNFAQIPLTNLLFLKTDSYFQFLFVISSPSVPNFIFTVNKRETSIPFIPLQDPSFKEHNNKINNSLQSKIIYNHDLWI